MVKVYLVLALPIFSWRIPPLVQRHRRHPRELPGQCYVNLSIWSKMGTRTVFNASPIIGIVIQSNWLAKADFDCAHNEACDFIPSLVLYTLNTSE